MHIAIYIYIHNYIDIIILIIHRHRCNELISSCLLNTGPKINSWVLGAGVLVVMWGIFVLGLFWDLG